MSAPKIISEPKFIPGRDGYFHVSALPDGMILLANLQEKRITPEEARRLGTALIESPRERYVPGEPPQWSRHANEARHLDGRPVAIASRHRSRVQRRQDKEFRKAYRNYRKHVIPMSKERECFMDSWWVIAAIALVVFVIYVARAMRWLS